MSSNVQITGDWYEVSKTFLDRFGAQVPDPSQERRYTGKDPDWAEIAANLRPFIYESAPVDHLPELTRDILKSWLREPSVADPKFNEFDYYTGENLWADRSFVNGRHRLTGVFSVEPDLLVPIRCDLIRGLEDDVYELQLLRIAEAQALQTGLEQSGGLPSTPQNRRFLERLSAVSVREITKPTPEFPGDIVVSGREPDLSDRNEQHGLTFHLWHQGGQALVLLSRDAGLDYGVFAGNLRKFLDTFPQLAEMLANSTMVTFVGESHLQGRYAYRVVCLKESVRVTTQFPRTWGPEMQVCVCQAGVKLSRRSE